MKSWIRHKTLISNLAPAATRSCSTGPVAVPSSFDGDWQRRLEIEHWDRRPAGLTSIRDTPMKGARRGGGWPRHGQGQDLVPRGRDAVRRAPEADLQPERAGAGGRGVWRRRPPP